MAAKVTSFLDRKAILGINDIRTETVEVPEWGTAIRIRGMNGAERDAFESALMQTDKKTGSMSVNMRNARARAVVMCAVDEAGNRLFEDGDIADLGKKNAAVLDRLYTVAANLSGIGNSDLDDLLGNSGSDQSDASTSA